jgi:hypothetical protein
MLSQAENLTGIVSGESSSNDDLTNRKDAAFVPPCHLLVEAKKIPFEVVHCKHEEKGAEFCDTAVPGAAPRRLNQELLALILPGRPTRKELP